MIQNDGSDGAESVGAPSGVPLSDMTGAGLRQLAGTLMQELDTCRPFEVIEILDRRLRDAVDAASCVLLLADYAESTLEPVPATDAAATTGTQPISDSPAGQAFRTQQAVRTDHAGVHSVHLPVTVRRERLGVLTVTFEDSGAAEQSEPPDHADLAAIARVLAYIVVEARRYTDRYERVRRRRDLGLPAEIQWELLPVLAYQDRFMSVAGNLQPAYDIGGDTFDYAVDQGHVVLAVNDAMGHGLQAALMASLAITAQRSVRRAGGDILEQVYAASARLDEQFIEGAFVTTWICQLDLVTGQGGVVNAGHPSPVLLRDGALQPVEVPPDPPMGVLPQIDYHVHEFGLRPGDRLILLTDGILECTPEAGGPAFGRQRVGDIVTKTATSHPTEVVRLLTAEVTDYRDGRLADDATAVCIDWHGPTR